MKSVIIFILAVLQTIISSSQNPITFDSLKIIEKVYLHVDRFFYNPGDNIWFKAYIIDASNRLLSDNSNNLHVEIISPTSKIIDSHIIRINDGLGNGDFQLPENLKSGRYSIRAYTNYMRNFGDQLFFNKDITIINSSDAVEELSDSIMYIRDKLEISFFPEGGSLVDNVSSIIAFKAVDALGVGCDVKGEVYSSTGESVTTFQSAHRGIGKFSLRPVPGINYFAIVKNLSGDEVKSKIPRSSSTGFVLNISKTNRNDLLVTVRTNIETLPMVLDQDLTITVSARKTPFKTAIFRMNSINNHFFLSTEDLPDGIVMLTLAGPDDLPYCERLVYLQNNEDLNINIETDKRVYNQRDSVLVKISLLADSGIAPDSFLSLSATESIAANNFSQFPSTISSWFLLESDVRGPVEEPSYYFDPTNPDRLDDLDLLLLTQGWRDFEWKYKYMKYLPENGFAVSGSLRKLLTNAPLEDSKVNIVILQSDNTLIGTAPTDDEGRFYLEGFDFSGEARLIVSAIGKKENLQGRLLLDSLSYSPANVQVNNPQTKLLFNDNQIIKGNINKIINEDIKELIKVAEKKKTVKGKYTLSDTINLNEVKIIAKRPEDHIVSHVKSSRLIYGLPDNELIVTPQLQNYNNAFQVLAGRIPGVHVGQVNRKYEDSGIRIRGSSGQPLFVLDGMTVPYDVIESLPVNMIDRIDVLKSAATISTFGARGANGVISVITRIGSTLTITNPVLHSTNITISGYNEPRIFYSPQHSSTLYSDYKPDLRTTLYWKPNIKLKSNKDLFLKYFNSDNSSNIDIIVEGITTTGIPISSKAEYPIR
jgi:hypothetical protein